MGILFNCSFSPSLCPTFNPGNTFDWFRCDYKLICDHLSCIDWDSEFLDCDVNQCYFKLTSVLFDIFKIAVPFKSVRPIRPPWTRNLSADLQIRRSEAWRQYKQLRRQFGRN